MKTIERLTVLFLLVFTLFVFLFSYYHSAGQIRPIIVEQKWPEIALELHNTPNYKDAPKPILKRRFGPINAHCEQYRSLLAKYSWDVDTMMRIMWAESQCSPIAHNTTDNHKVCMGSYGLLQIACSHFKVGEDRYDIALNIAKGYSLYQKRGTYTDWTTY